MASIPCGVFWDIQNIGVPKGQSASTIVSLIRSSLIDSYNLREIYFYCVCDVTKLPVSVGNPLTNLDVNIIQAYDYTKDSADLKILDLMRKFVENQGNQESAVVLLSGDGDYVAALDELKKRYNITVYLIRLAQSFSLKLEEIANYTFMLKKNELIPVKALGIHRFLVSFSRYPASRPINLVIADLNGMTRSYGNLDQRAYKCEDQIIVPLASPVLANRAITRFNKARYHGTFLKVEMFNNVPPIEMPNVSSIYASQSSDKIDLIDQISSIYSSISTDSDTDSCNSDLIVTDRQPYHQPQSAGSEESNQILSSTASVVNPKVPVGQSVFLTIGNISLLSKSKQARKQTCKFLVSFVHTVPRAATVDDHAAYFHYNTLEEAEKAKHTIETSKDIVKLKATISTDVPANWEVKTKYYFGLPRTLPAPSSRLITYISIKPVLESRGSRSLGNSLLPALQPFFIHFIRHFEDSLWIGIGNPLQARAAVTAFEEQKCLNDTLTVSIVKILPKGFWRTIRDKSKSNSTNDLKMLEASNDSSLNGSADKSDEVKRTRRRGPRRRSRSRRKKSASSVSETQNGRNKSSDPPNGVQNPLKPLVFVTKNKQNPLESKLSESANPQKLTKQGTTTVLADQKKTTLSDGNLRSANPPVALPARNIGSAIPKVSSVDSKVLPSSKSSSSISNVGIHSRLSKSTNEYPLVNDEVTVLSKPTSTSSTKPCGTSTNYVQPLTKSNLTGQISSDSSLKILQNDTIHQSTMIPTILNDSSISYLIITSIPRTILTREAFLVVKSKLMKFDCLFVTILPDYICSGFGNIDKRTNAVAEINGYSYTNIFGHNYTFEARAILRPPSILKENIKIADFNRFSSALSSKQIDGTFKLPLNESNISTLPISSKYPSTRPESIRNFVNLSAYKPIHSRNSDSTSNTNRPSSSKKSPKKSNCILS